MAAVIATSQGYNLGDAEFWEIVAAGMLAGALVGIAVASGPALAAAAITPLKTAGGELLVVARRTPG